MTLIDCEQYSPEWWTARRGIPTASQFSRIIRPVKGGMSTSAMGYVNELVADRIKFDPPLLTEQPATQAMRFGTATEPEARAWYSLDRNVDVRKVGLCMTDDLLTGCSPDGLVGDDGGLELKCPELKTHVRYVLGEKLPDEYKAQVHGCLLVTGRRWWDFCSYHPDAPRQLVVRVTPDKFTEQLADVLTQFHAFLRAAWERIGERPPIPTEVAA